MALAGVTVQAKRGKKQFVDNMAENSSAFKELGTLHREKRAV